EKKGGKNGNGIKLTLTAINYFRELANTRYKRPVGSKPFVIAVTNLKGGVAKTQTAVDLAKKLAITGLRCLILDFDGQGTATLLTSGLIPDLELDYEDTITNTLVSDPNLIHGIILKTHFDGLHLIPANLAIQDCDLLLPNTEYNNQKSLGSPFHRVKTALDLVKENYDVILIDCGPNLAVLTLNALISCNGLIIPIPPQIESYSSFVTYASSLSNLFKQININQLDYCRFLLSKHKADKEAKAVDSMIRGLLGGLILAKHMCDTVEVSKAANEISTIYDISKPRGSIAAHLRAIKHLDEVTDEIIEGFKDVWSYQAQEHSTEDKKELAHG
ncbi:MAG: AAA family ATPase, partial [Gammaproteobacteria bacterium]